MVHYQSPYCVEYVVTLKAYSNFKISFVDIYEDRLRNKTFFFNRESTPTGINKY